MDRLVLATHNAGKVKEFETLLAGLTVQVESAADHNLFEPEETRTTFEENALIKARAACAATGLPSLADDSGLAVEALGGAPGIYSARWAGPEKDFGHAMQRIHDELNGDVEGQKAAFVAVLALVFPDGREEIFEGRVEGTLTWPARGDKGFGYDPIFVPGGYDISFAQMDPAEKNALSHRSKAVKQFTTFLTTEAQRHGVF